MYMSIVIQGSTIRNSINQNAAKPHQFKTQNSKFKTQYVLHRTSSL